MESTSSPSSNGNGNNGHCSSYDIIRWFDDVSENAGKVQTGTLRRILELNCGVEYLKKWLGDIKIQEMDACALESLYTSLVPLASHADLDPYIQRIADGDTTPLLTQQPIATLSLSSGTTEGRQKYVPFTRHSSQTTLQIFSLAAAYRSRVYPIKEGGKILELIYSSKQFKTKGGLTVGTATTHYYASEEFKIKQEKTKSFTCSPPEVISGGDYKQTTYCHLLLGLFFYDQVEFITSTFAYSIVQAFISFEELWKEICDDIREGSLSSRITLPKMRKAVLDIISPSPCLASRIEDNCKKLENLDWLGLIPKLWPNAKYVYSIMTGSMQPYLRKLRHYACGLALVSADYGSTESWIGVNVDPSLPPENVTFAVVPTFSYFEFMPLYRQNKDFSSAIDDFIEDEPVPLSKVKLGQEYEIVLTTFTGLYRYRLGDVVEVAGFHKGTPKLNFICRRKLILTVNIDKNTEKDLQLVVERGSQLLSKTRAELVDFTSHADVGNQPGHYIIYWEIKGEVEEGVLGECCREMDESFVDHGYVVSRKAHSIGPLELCIVERGTFKKILDHFIGNGAALSQFKTPRCTSNQVLLRILNVCTIKRFHSTAYG
ncbi:indole-3-acetic acid-amido synthetase GH3.10 [Ricinus communis]|uniref:Indole-3-acetic acid-amido synthetase GH3.5, putative n=1 Tax=Ricinus communis TaxID=3988 RepID=B9RW45_RICCO|nr:indole-3-acetic acid-amido synthetase GH3.10 [Ricinus communis]EEF44482.1 Indole-3-acetic acid-amido synthetase GH3.5, putative [Ricinus communis]|eukprot:XP_002517964.1 indole-3-acetic acid-amido synthetase GH3.10 [Ricinus communis]